jgi:hypothetical protein
MEVEFIADLPDVSALENGGIAQTGCSSNPPNALKCSERPDRWETNRSIRVDEEALAMPQAASPAICSEPSRLFGRSHFGGAALGPYPSKILRDLHTLSERPRQVVDRGASGASLA